jgi:hypothetical protein
MRRVLRFHHLRYISSAAIVALGATAAWRYSFKPPRGVHTSPQDLSIGNAEAPPLNTLSNFRDLENLAHSRCVVLVTRGYSPRLAHTAESAFFNAIARLASRFPDLSFCVVSDSSDATSATTLLTRLGLVHDNPYVVVLDRFAETEEKYLMTTQRGVPSATDTERFVANFVAGKLHPAMLGQSRPPNDRSESYPDLWEVVTSSFDEVVLDPSVDVLLETQSPRCDACKALAPRLRILATFAKRHAPKLRIATMNILDNDKSRAYLPEVSNVLFELLQHTPHSPPPLFHCCTPYFQKWTPCLRLFPAVTPTDVGAPQNGLKKHSILLSTVPQHAKHPAELPTLPQILTAIVDNTAGRIEFNAAALAEAEQLECVAQQLERALATVLDYMDTWERWDEHVQRQGAFADARDVADVAELRGRLSHLYSFLQDDAAADSLPKTEELLREIAAIIDRHNATQPSQGST